MVQLVAAPLISGLGALGLSTTAATTIATAGLYVATSAASILLQMSMVEEPKQDIGTKLSAVLGGAVNQSIHFGRKETAGSFLYKNAWGRSGRVPNAYLVRVYCLGDRPVDGFEDYIWAGGKKCNYDPGETQSIDGLNVGHPINAFDANGGHRLWVKFHDGSQTSADNYLVGKFGADPQRAWTNDHIGRGRPYMIVTQKYDKKEPAGEIDVTAVVKNARYYDWRNDSTNGGSGSERYGNYGTYSVDNGNPVRVIYNIMRGIYFGNEWMYGGQSWPATRFDNDSWTAAANKCDEDVSISGGGTQKRFRCGGEVDCSEEPWTVIERCLKACNGRIVESGGVFKIYVGGIGASVYSFTDDDIIVSEEMTGRMFPTREKIASTVTGTYAEPDSAGEAKAFKARFKQAYIDADGDVRKTTMDFEYVRDNRQAQRLASMALNDNRRFRTFVVAFWTQARKLEPCDVVNWTSTRFGFTNKKFIVGANPLREDGIVVVNLREADANDANWSTSDEDEFEIGVFDDIDPAPQSLTADVTATAITDDDDVTELRPAIRIEATLDDDFVDCRALRYQVRKKNGDQKIIHRGLSEGFFEPDNPDYGDFIFTSSAFKVGRQVQVRFKIEPESDRDTEWSDWEDHEITLTDIPETGVSDDPPADLASDPTMTLSTRVKNSGEIVQRLLVDLDLTGRDAKEGYIIRVLDTTDSEPTRYETKEFPFAVPVIANHSYEVRVAPVSRFGVKGTFSGLATGFSMPIPKKSTLPTVAAGLTTKRWPGGIKVKWSRNTDSDYRETALLRNTVNNSTTAVEVFRGRANSFWDPDVVNGTRYYYWALDFDTSDNPAASVSVVDDDIFTAIGTSDTDRTTLSAPTGVSLTQANRDVDKDGTVDIALLTTFSGSVAGATGYEVEWADSAGQVASARADTGKFWFKANTTRSYQTRWRAYDWTNAPGNWSSYSGSVTPAATTVAPPNASGVSASAIPSGFLVSWSAPSNFDYDYTEISVDGGSTIIDHAKGNRKYVYHPVYSNTTVSVRHVNTSGLKSASWTNSGTFTRTGTVDGYYMLLGTSASGVLGVLPYVNWQVTLTWICDNNATGVTIDLNGTTFTGIDFVAGAAMSLTAGASASGSIISISKTGGIWRRAGATISVTRSA